MFNLFHFHGWDLNTMENLPPYELQVYRTLLVNHLEEVKRRQEMENR